MSEFNFSNLQTSGKKAIIESRRFGFYDEFLATRKDGINVYSGCICRIAAAPCEVVGLPTEGQWDLGEIELADIPTGSLARIHKNVYTSFGIDINLSDLEVKVLFDLNQKRTAIQELENQALEMERLFLLNKSLSGQVNAHKEGMRKIMSTIEEVNRINLQGGPGSRRRVRELIDSIR